MFEAPDHPTLVRDHRHRSLDALSTDADDRPDGNTIDERMAVATDTIADLQQRMYADARWSVLIVFQGRDAAGKDGTIRHVFQQVSPSGVTANAFGPPPSEELAHDFLWRTSQHLPRRGHFAVFNRSYYEEVPIARVRPDLLAAQGLPDLPPGAPDDQF